MKKYIVLTHDEVIKIIAEKFGVHENNVWLTHKGKITGVDIFDAIIDITDEDERNDK